LTSAIGAGRYPPQAGFHERLTGKDAELAYNAAKGRILKKLAGIKIVKNRAVLSRIGNAKPQKGTYEAYKYAPLGPPTCCRWCRAGPV